METYKDVINGRGYNASGERVTLNAHISYKGRSIIIDYECELHDYPSCVKENLNRLVPFEIYPFGGDIAVGYANVDSEFHKCDLIDLIAQVDRLLAEEQNVSYDADME